jgi:metabotropic glutamate receptor 6/7/8
MEFVKSSLTTVDNQINDYQCADRSSPLYIPRKPVVGVIGASSSSVSVMVANILRLFQVIIEQKYLLAFSFTFCS